MFQSCLEFVAKISHSRATVIQKLSKIISNLSHFFSSEVVSKLNQNCATIVSKLSQVVPKSFPCSSHLGCQVVSIRFPCGHEMG